MKVVFPLNKKKQKTIFHKNNFLSRSRAQIKFKMAGQALRRLMAEYKRECNGLAASELAP
jgi:hypothetical protein